LATSNMHHKNIGGFFYDFCLCTKIEIFNFFLN